MINLLLGITLCILGFAILITDTTNDYSVLGVALGLITLGNLYFTEEHLKGKIEKLSIKIDELTNNPIVILLEDQEDGLAAKIVSKDNNVLADKIQQHLAND